MFGPTIPEYPQPISCSLAKIESRCSKADIERPFPETGGPFKSLILLSALVIECPLLSISGHCGFLHRADLIQAERDGVSDPFAGVL